MNAIQKAILTKMKQAALDARNMSLPFEEVRAAMPQLIVNMCKAVGASVPPSMAAAITSEAIECAFGPDAFCDVLVQLAKQLIKQTPGLASSQLAGPTKDSMCNAAASAACKFDLGGKDPEWISYEARKAWEQAKLSMAGVDITPEQVEVAINKLGAHAAPKPASGDLQSSGLFAGLPKEPHHVNSKCALPRGEESRLDRELRESAEAFEAGVASIVKRRREEGDPWVCRGAA